MKINKVEKEFMQTDKLDKEKKYILNQIFDLVTPTTLEKWDEISKLLNEYSAVDFRIKIREYTKK